MSQRCQKQSGPSFDHLVGGGDQLVGDFEAERFRGWEVDDEIDLGRQLDRHVGWSRTAAEQLRHLQDTYPLRELLSHLPLAANFGPTSSSPEPRGVCGVAGPHFLILLAAARSLRYAQMICADACSSQRKLA
jgi:hypothetical protein